MKMKKILSLAGFGLLCSSFSVTANAANLKGGINIFAGAGYVDFDSDRNTDDEALYHIGIGYNFNEYIGVEGRASYFRSHDNVANDKRDGHFISADLVYHIVPCWPIVPFLFAGAGVNMIDAEVGLDHTNFMVEGGGGLKFFFTDNVGIRLDARNVYTFTRNYNDQIYNGSLFFQFAGLPFQKQQHMPPQPEPMPIEDEYRGKGDVMHDSDNDGVADLSDKCAGTLGEFKVDAEGCATLAANEEVEVALDVKFDFDKTNVKSEFGEKIEQVAVFMKEHPNTKAILEGYTDSKGPAAYNIQLSEKRANAVREYLIKKHNIDPKRVAVIGKGQANPIADNATEAGRSLNRRVVTTIHDKQMEEAVKLRRQAMLEEQSLRTNPKMISMDPMGHEYEPAEFVELVEGPPAAEIDLQAEDLQLIRDRS